MAWQQGLTVEGINERPTSSKPYLRGRVRVRVRGELKCGVKSSPFLLKTEG